jgi:hypothetical protein
MTPRSRSALTLASLACAVGLSGVIGWQALTAPLPEQEKLPPCVATAVGAGEVSDLTERGFHRGTGGNAPGAVKKGIQIWAEDPTSADAALVAAQFRKAEIVEGEALGPGVVVVVGTDVPLRSVTKAPDQIEVKSAGTICTPPGHDSLATG